MTFFIAFSALSSACFALLGYMTDLVAAEACSRVAVMVMVLSEAIKAFHLSAFLKAIFGYMSFFTASIAFNQPIFIIISIFYRLKIPYRSFSLLFFLFLFLLLFYLLNGLLFFFVNINIIFINFNELNDFLNFILSLLSLSQILNDLYSLLLNFFDSLIKVITTNIFDGLIALYFVGMKIINFRDSLRFINLSFLDQKNIVFCLSFRDISIDLFKTINVEYIIFHWIFCRFWSIFASFLNDGCILPILGLNNFNRRRSISLLLSLLLCEFRLLRFNGRLPAIHLNHYS